MSDETGETKVTIKFTDPEKAKDFVRNVKEGRTLNIIKRVSTVPAEQDSFALGTKTIPTVAFLLFTFFCVALA